MASMTPEEALSFYEEDEDPGEVFAWFDAGPHHVTARPIASCQLRAAVQQPAATEMVARVVASGLYDHLRGELLPQVTTTGSISRIAAGAQFLRIHQLR